MPKTHHGEKKIQAVLSGSYKQVQMSRFCLIMAWFCYRNNPPEHITLEANALICGHKGKNEEKGWAWYAFAEFVQNWCTQSVSNQNSSTMDCLLVAMWFLSIIVILSSVSRIQL